MKIPQEIAEKVIDGTMEDLYNLFITLEGEYDDFQEEYDMVRWGKEVMFEIHDLWEDTHRIRMREKEGEVWIQKIAYALHKFRTEKEERRKIMVKAILDNTADKGTIAPRG